MSSDVSSCIAIDASINRPKNNPFKIMVVAVTLAAFFVNMFAYDLAYAAPSAVTSAKSQPDKLNPINLPSYLGYVKDAWSPTPTPNTQYAIPDTVIHIQDAHCNYPAQNTIYSIIDYLSKTYDVSIVNLEGGEGSYDFSAFNNLKDPNIRSGVADYFLKEGVINAAEAYAVNNPGKMSLWGVEDTALYMENLNVYRDSLKHKDDIDRSLKAIDSSLSDLKSRIYSEQLLALDKKTADFKEKSVELKDYIKYLTEFSGQNKIDILDLKNISILNKSLSSEKDMDFKKANIERDQLIDKLNKCLSRNEIGELVEKAVEFKLNRIQPSEFYNYILGKARQLNIDLSDYKNMELYTGYLGLYAALKNEELFKELAVLEERIRGKLFRSEEERGLDRLSANLRIMKNLLNITLTQDEFSYYAVHKKDFTSEKFIIFISKEAPKYGVDFTSVLDGLARLDSYISHIEKFYALSYKRDEKFVENLQGLSLKRAVPKITILITGGFHTDNLTGLLKKKGMPYVSIMPNFGLDNQESPYFKLLSGNNSAILKYIASNMSTLAIHTYLDRHAAEIYGGDMQAALAKWSELVASIVGSPGQTEHEISLGDGLSLIVSCEEPRRPGIVEAIPDCTLNDTQVWMVRPGENSLLIKQSEGSAKKILSYAMPILKHALMNFFFGYLLFSVIGIFYIHNSLAPWWDTPKALMGGAAILCAVIHKTIHVDSNIRKLKLWDYKLLQLYVVYAAYAVTCGVIAPGIFTHLALYVPHIESTKNISIKLSNGMPVPIYYDTEEGRREAVGILNILPPQHLNRVSSIYLTDRAGIPHANPMSNKIVSHGGLTLVHEIGHLFYYNSLSPEEKNAWVELNKMSVTEDDFVSEYARENYDEDFAETYKSYVAGIDSYTLRVSPIKLKKIELVAKHFIIEQDGKKYILLFDATNGRIHKLAFQLNGELSAGLFKRLMNRAHFISSIFDSNEGPHQLSDWPLHKEIVEIPFITASVNEEMDLLNNGSYEDDKWFLGTWSEKKSRYYVDPLFILRFERNTLFNSMPIREFKRRLEFVEWATRFLKNKDTINWDLSAGFDSSISELRQVQRDIKYLISLQNRQPNVKIKTSPYVMTIYHIETLFRFLDDERVKGRSFTVEIRTDIYDDLVVKINDKDIKAPSSPKIEEIKKYIINYIDHNIPGPSTGLKITRASSSGSVEEQVSKVMKSMRPEFNGKEELNGEEFESHIIRIAEKSNIKYRRADIGPISIIPQNLKYLYSALREIDIIGGFFASSLSLLLISHIPRTVPGDDECVVTTVGKTAFIAPLIVLAIMAHFFPGCRIFDLMLRTGLCTSIITGFFAHDNLLKHELKHVYTDLILKKLKRKNVGVDHRLLGFDLGQPLFSNNKISIEEILRIEGIVLKAVIKSSGNIQTDVNTPPQTEQSEPRASSSGSGPRLPGYDQRGVTDSDKENYSRDLRDRARPEKNVSVKLIIGGALLFMMLATMIAFGPHSMQTAYKSAIRYSAQSRAPPEVTRSIVDKLTRQSAVVIDAWNRQISLQTAFNEDASLEKFFKGFDWDSPGLSERLKEWIANKSPQDRSAIQDVLARNVYKYVKKVHRYEPGAASLTNAEVIQTRKLNCYRACELLVGLLNYLGYSGSAIVVDVEKDYEGNEAGHACVVYFKKNIHEGPGVVILDATYHNTINGIENFGFEPMHQSMGVYNPATGSLDYMTAEELKARVRARSISLSEDDIAAANRVLFKHLSPENQNEIIDNIRRMVNGGLYRQAMEEMKKAEKYYEESILLFANSPKKRVLNEENLRNIREFEGTCRKNMESRSSAGDISRASASGIDWPLLSDNPSLRGLNKEIAAKEKSPALSALASGAEDQTKLFKSLSQILDDVRMPQEPRVFFLPVKDKNASPYHAVRSGILHAFAGADFKNAKIIFYDGTKEDLMKVYTGIISSSNISGALCLAYVDSGRIDESSFTEHNEKNAAFKWIRESAPEGVSAKELFMHIAFGLTILDYLKNSSDTEYKGKLFEIIKGMVDNDGKDIDLLKSDLGNIFSFSFILKLKRITKIDINHELRSGERSLKEVLTAA